ncbi:MAG: hypothetical protein ACM3O7_12135 [Acidobacteriota bacterium]
MSMRIPSFLWLGCAVLAVAATSPAVAQQTAAGQVNKVALLQPLPGSSGASSEAAAAPGDTSSQDLKKAVEEAAPVKVGGKERLTIKGFVSATFFAQDQSFSFGNGQNAQWPETSNTTNKWFSGGDVRNTRLTLDFSGPEVADGWKVGALVEGDFFGGYNGTGAFSHQQAVGRLRLAYADLTKGGTTLRIGQFWSPLFGEVPESLSHIAFPLGYGSAGMVGWRFPGVFLYQQLSQKNSKTKIQLDLAAFEGSWNGPGSPISNLSAGSVGFRPQVEGKLNFMGKTAGGNAWKLYVAGHWDQKDLSGVGGGAPTPLETTITGTGVEVGGSYKVGGFLIHGNVYTTKGAGQQFAAITQFGDIKDTGGWLQLGYDITKRWSVYGFCGMVDANKDDVLKWVGANGRIKNQQGVVMLEWSLGQYQLGLEYLHDEVKVGAAETKVKGNQIALSARYFF